MAAYNWILVNIRCAGCGRENVVRCQTHVASDYAGDSSGRFHDREYVLGESMAWWPRADERFGSWKGGRWIHTDPSSSMDQEACYATCSLCGTDLYVIIRFEEHTPVDVIAIGREEEWPDGYLK
jgi:hypothetical protein